MSAGPGPGAGLSPWIVGLRSSSGLRERFVKGRMAVAPAVSQAFTTITTNNHDHIGGLETENEGQPRGLWTRYVPRSCPATSAPAHPAPGEDPGDELDGSLHRTRPWPKTGSDSDADHSPADDEAYENRSRADAGTGHLATRSTSSGCRDLGGRAITAPSGRSLGEHFDDKRGLPHSSRPQGPAHRRLGAGPCAFSSPPTPLTMPAETIFWILSEGPDKRREPIPSKGDSAAVMPGAWTPQRHHGARPMIEDETYNRDNIVLKLYSRDWQGDASRPRKPKTRRGRAPRRPSCASCGQALAGRMSRRGFEHRIHRRPVPAWPQALSLGGQRHARPTRATTAGTTATRHLDGLHQGPAPGPVERGKPNSGRQPVTIFARFGLGPRLAPRLLHRRPDGLTVRTT